MYLILMAKKDSHTRLLGRKFGKLVVLSFNNLDGNDRTTWLCECECGKKKVIRNDSLVRGITTSCGCARYVNPCGSTNSGWKGFGEISGNYWRHIQGDAKRREITFSISIEDAWELFLHQDRKCAMTGVIMQFSKKRRGKDRTASLDRIDSTKDYTIDNVQWVIKEVNLAKGTMTSNEFTNLCKLVVKYAGVV